MINSMQEHGVNLLAIRAMNPSKYALSLMDAIFSDDEMCVSCFSCGKRGTKPELPQEKVKLIEGIIIIIIHSYKLYVYVYVCRLH